MTRLTVTLAIALIGMLVPCAGAPAAAQHDCSWVERSTVVNGMIITKTVWVCAGHATTPDNTKAGDYGESGNQGGVSECVRTAEELGITSEHCNEIAQPGAPSQAPTLTPGLIQQAFNRMRLPPSKLIIQPPRGKTLINFKTNFYTRRSPIQRSITLLGRRIHFRITADQFTWHFGDGSKKTTRTPGAPYPDLLVTHNYRKKGRYRPSLDTTYVADFRVGNGAWRSVTGLVTISGEPQRLRAIGAKPVLTSPYD